MYDTWSGTLYQTKDKSTHKILWELQETNVKGQVTLARLGATNIRNRYDTNGFLYYINHTSEKHPSMLYVSYSFNAIKNELNSRNTMGEWNILENFVYDDNNRLINWTNPVNGTLHQNIYDKKGRIIENDQLGKSPLETPIKSTKPPVST